MHVKTGIFAVQETNFTKKQTFQNEKLGYI